MGSIAMDGSGNIAIGYNVSGASTYPSLRYAGRLADDPLGEMARGEASLIEGSGSMTEATRWGDYSAVSVDPSDDCTFWFTGEYLVKDTPYEGWHTRIGSFRFPSCGMAVTARAEPGSGHPPLAVSFTASGTGGVAPHTFEWDFGDGATGSGEAVSHTYTFPGSFRARVTLRDAAGGAVSAGATVLVTAKPPVISDVTKLSSPFRLRVTGENFHAGCTIRVNGVAVPQTQFQGAATLVASGGSRLKAMVPKGQAVPVTVLNDDDGGISAPFSYTR